LRSAAISDKFGTDGGFTMRSIPMLLLALLLALGAGASTISCSSSTTTTRTVEHPSADGTSSVTTTTEESDDDGPHFGILSGTVKAIGWVLSLPFKIVGGLISLIF